MVALSYGHCSLRVSRIRISFQIVQSLLVADRSADRSVSNSNELVVLQSKTAHPSRVVLRKAIVLFRGFSAFGYLSAWSAGSRRQLALCHGFAAKSAVRNKVADFHSCSKIQIKWNKSSVSVSRRPLERDQVFRAFARHLTLSLRLGALLLRLGAFFPLFFP